MKLGSKGRKWSRAAAAVLVCAALAAPALAAESALGDADPSGLASGTVTIAGSTGSWRCYELVSGEVVDDRIDSCSTAGLMNETFWTASGIDGTDQDAAEELASIAASDEHGAETARLGRAAEKSHAAHVDASAQSAEAGFQLSSGYWLLVSDTQQPMLLLVGGGGVSATVKSEAPTLDKTVRLDGGDYSHAVEAGRGDTPEYRIECTMPSNSAAYERLSYRVVDELPAGEKVSVSDVAVTATREDGYKKDITASCGVTVSAGRLVVDVGDGDALALLGDDCAETTVTVSYAATVRSRAVTGTDGNPNTAYIEYTGSPTTDARHSTPTSTAQLVCWKVVLEKTGSGHPLTGARFELLDGDGEAVGSGTTSASGAIAFPQVPSGTYTLRETAAPSGFEEAEDTEVTIEASFDDDVAKAKLSASAQGAGRVTSADPESGTVSVTVDDEAVSGSGEGGDGGSSGGSYAKTGATIAPIAGAALAAAALGSLLVGKGRRKKGQSLEQGESAS